MSDQFYGIWNPEQKNSSYIFNDGEGKGIELLRLHSDGKVTVRGEIYNNMSEMVRDVFGTCKWIPEKDMDGDTIFNTECDERASFQEGSINENSYKYCPYCSKEIEEVKE